MLVRGWNMSRLLESWSVKTWKGKGRRERRGKVGREGGR